MHSPRQEKIISVVRSRQFDLRLVLENVHDPHNVSAVFRTCDAVGVPKVSLIYNYEKFPKIGKKSSASAYKWVDKDKYKTPEECYRQLRNEGFTIYASILDDKAKSIYDLDLSNNVAIVMGNEHRGVSKEAAALSDGGCYIPMVGMVQSLNISVAAAIIIYEAMRQRYKAGYYHNPKFNEQFMHEQLDYYMNK